MPAKHKRTDLLGTEALKPYRDQLDQVNTDIVDLLSKRMHICRTIARIKAASNLPMMQPHRIASTLDHVTTLSQTRELRPEYLKHIFELIINETCDEESRIMKNEHPHH